MVKEEYIRLFVTSTQAQNKFLQELNKSLAEIKGMDFERFLALEAIESLSIPVTASTTGKYLVKNPNTMSTIFDRMEDAGLITKTRAPKGEDRRIVYIKMTAIGRERWYLAREIVSKSVEENKSLFRR